MRWIYNITLEGDKHATCISVDRIYDCLGRFRNRFGEDAVVGVTERWGAGPPTPSYLLPTCEEEAEAINQNLTTLPKNGTE